MHTRLPTYTKEQLSQRAEKAREGRIVAIKTGSMTFRQNWEDDEYWNLLAKKYNIKLPQKHVAPSVSKILKIARALKLINEETSKQQWIGRFFGIDIKNVSEGLQKEHERQPDGMKYGMRAYVGWMLEQVVLEMAEAK